jgi:hypothetical protein
MMLLLIISVILLELIVLVGSVYFILKYFSKINPVSNIVTSDVIRDGIKSAMQEISYKEWKEKPHKKGMAIPTPIYSTAYHDEPVVSDGDLIPYDLSEKDKAMLDMFYNND